MRLPKRIEASKKKEQRKDNSICCADCMYCQPLEKKPNLDYKGEPFLNTCPMQPWEKMMYRKHECEYFKQKSNHHL